MKDINVGDMRSVWKKFVDWVTSLFTSPHLERRPLPIGRKEFYTWADRILALADVNADKRSLYFSLQGMILSMGPTDAFREDAYFALALRSAANKQTAHMLMQEIKEEQFKEQQELKKKKESEMANAIAPNLKAIDGLLEKQAVQGSISGVEQSSN